MVPLFSFFSMGKKLPVAVGFLDSSAELSVQLCSRLLGGTQGPAAQGEHIPSPNKFVVTLQNWTAAGAFGPLTHKQRMNLGEHTWASIAEKTRY